MSKAKKTEKQVSVATGNSDPFEKILEEAIRDDPSIRHALELYKSLKTKEERDVFKRSFPEWYEEDKRRKEKEMSSCLVQTCKDGTERLTPNTPSAAARSDTRPLKYGEFGIFRERDRAVLRANEEKAAKLAVERAGGVPLIEHVRVAGKSEEETLSPEKISRLCNEAIEFCKTAHPPTGEGRVAWERFLARAGFFSECTEWDLAVLDDLKTCDRHEPKKRKERMLRLRYFLARKRDVLKEGDQLRSREDIQSELQNLYDEELRDSWISEDGSWVYWRRRWENFCRQVKDLHDPLCNPEISLVEEFWKDRWKEIAETWRDSRAALKKWDGQALPPGSEKTQEAKSDGTKQSVPVGGRENTSDRQRDLEMFVESARGEMSTPSLRKWAGGKLVTLAIVFTDIPDSTALGKELRDERMGKVRQAHFAQSRKLSDQFEGREIKTIGDSVMVLFHSVDQALDYAMALHANPGHARVQIRAGIHIGPMQVEENDVFGTEVDFAARVKEAFKGAEIWLSDQAKGYLDKGGAAQFDSLVWERHDGVPMKGFAAAATLWSLRK